MKNLLLAALFFSCLSVFAQEEEQTEKKPRTQENEAKDRLVLGFSFDNWLHDVDSLTTKWNSFGFHAYFMYDIPLGKSRFSAAPGFGFSGSWVKNNSALDDSNDSIGTFFTPLSIDYKRNSLARVFFDVPVELRYRSKPNPKNKSFKMAAGVIGGIQMSNRTSIKSNDPAISPSGDTKIFRTHRYGDLMKFRFGPTFRVGYGAFNLFFYYSVTNMFAKDEGPIVRPFSAGISINGL